MVKSGEEIGFVEKVTFQNIPIAFINAILYKSDSKLTQNKVQNIYL